LANNQQEKSQVFSLQRWPNGMIKLPYEKKCRFDTISGADIDVRNIESYLDEFQNT
jgi:hypothetical protein